jgi:hypothetical protein
LQDQGPIEYVIPAVDELGRPGSEPYEALGLECNGLVGGVVFPPIERDPGCELSQMVSEPRDALIHVIKYNDRISAHRSHEPIGLAPFQGGHVSFLAKQELEPLSQCERLAPAFFAANEQQRFGWVK